MHLPYNYNTMRTDDQKLMYYLNLPYQFVCIGFYAAFNISLIGHTDFSECLTNNYQFLPSD